MCRLFPLFLFLMLCVPAMGWAQDAAPHPTPPAPPQNQCRAAIGAAEREAGLPAGLLGAIGRVESGRRDEATGQVGPWPWTVNAQGQGRYFPSKAEAVAHVRQLQAAGVRVIDVGCMQINLYYHPDAFPGLEQALDPLANARYAARFLRELHARAGDWMRAAGHYHSQTPERAEAYRNAVAAALPAAQREAGSAPAWNPAWSAGPRPVMAGGATPRGGTAGVPGGGMGATVNRTVGPSNAPSGGMGGVPGGAVAEAGRGRGLDAYRAVAIPLATRLPPALAARGG